MAVAAILNLKKNSIFGHETVIEFDIGCSVPNFIKIGRFFLLRYGDLTIFKMATIRHLRF